jgi:hypothetical protein
MAAVSHRLLRQVLRTRLETVTALPVRSRIAYENRQFTPPNPPSTWIREWLQPATEVKVATKTVEARGRVQFDIVVPQGKGTTDAEDLANDIAEVFEPGTSLQGQGIEVAIDRTEQGQGTQDSGDDAWWFLPVSILWRYYATTTV